MTSKVFRVLFRPILVVWIIALHNDTRKVEGFCPGDDSSIAAAVAAAHIGKPPRFQGPSIRYKTEKKDAACRSCSNFDMSHKYDVIGKAPKNNSNRKHDTLRSSPVIHSQFNHRCDTIPIKIISVDTNELLSNTSLEKPSPSDRITSVEVDVTQRDFENILFAKRNELEHFISENTSVPKDKSEIDNTINCDSDEGGIDDVPTVHAIFCGYKATTEDMIRLRSAHVM